MLSSGHLLSGAGGGRRSAWEEILISFDGLPRRSWPEIQIPESRRAAKSAPLVHLHAPATCTGEEFVLGPAGTQQVTRGEFLVRARAAGRPAGWPTNWPQNGRQVASSGAAQLMPDRHANWPLVAPALAEANPPRGFVPEADWAALGRGPRRAKVNSGSELWAGSV